MNRVREKRGREKLKGEKREREEKEGERKKGEMRKKGKKGFFFLASDLCHTSSGYDLVS